MIPIRRLFPLHTPVLVLALASLAGAQVQPDAVLLRFPDVSRDHIAFRYDGDLWLVAKTGGQAERLTTARGGESLPRFSPDGKRLAFMGGYEGGSDLYVLSIEAGVPERVTWHPGQEMLCDWTPDGQSLLFWSSEVSGLGRAPRILKVAASGGQPEPLPVPYGTFGGIDETGTWLAYTMGSREFRTWKRYQGGMAQDVWLFDLASHASRRMTDFAGTDALPMWHGREVVFLSDRGDEGRANLWAYDMDSGETRRLTDFREDDVKFPSIGPDDVVFEAGGRLYRYEFATQKSVPVQVLIPGERPNLAPRTRDVSDDVSAAAPGPTGTRIVVCARGDVFSVPADEGITRNLTRTDGVFERDPVWSPDARWIAYFSDRSGEYELWLRRADGKTFDGADENGEKRVTSLGEGWKLDPRWSPDSRKIVFGGNDGAIRVIDVESGAVTEVGRDPQGDPVQASWSGDSGWLAWSHRHSRSRLGAIHLYELATRTLHEVTSGMFDDSNPVFDPDGDWLYFVSKRTFEPIYEDFGTTWIYTNASNVMAVPLRADVENPWAPKDDQEEIADEDEGEDADEDEDADDGEAADEAPADDARAADGEDEEARDGAEDEDAADERREERDEPLRIDVEGFEGRVLQLPVAAGELGNLEAVPGRVCYVRRTRTGAEDGPSSLHCYDMEEKEDLTILDEIAGGYVPTADGKKLLVFRRGEIAIVDVRAGQRFEALDLSGLVATIDPRDEWRQILDDVYRLYRDYFYEPGLHGVDWREIHDRYVRALADATAREDVHLFISEMISELNVGHAYNRSVRGVFEDPDRARPVGLLGCDWTVEQGAYRIARILGSEGPYDVDGRSPLFLPGVDVRAGDWLLAVNGNPVGTDRAVYAAFLDTVGKPTELTVNAAPTRDGNERTVLVEPIDDESDLRYRAWVAHNRAKVEELSGGRIGYVHVPNTGIQGQNELMRQFQGEMHHDALIVDERWNAGGQIPTRFIELLSRPITNFWAVRHGEDWSWPPVGHRGPKAMLINGWAGSGGDAFPYYFRQAGLGRLIGMRTWGGLVGLSGNPSLIDGTSPSVPRFAFYELDGTWGVEGYGVPPDIEVVDDPAAMQKGGDPQLEAAVTHLMTELESWRRPEPMRPGGPDRSRTGLPTADR